MQTSTIISRTSCGVSRKRRGFWNGNWFYWTLNLINYTRNLLWRSSQFKSIQFTIKSNRSSQPLSLYQSSGTAFKRRTFGFLFPGLSLRHWISNSYARMHWNPHCTSSIRPGGHSAGNITLLGTRYHGKATRHLAMGFRGGSMIECLGHHVTIYIL
jgi:hypothetical protein